jgi:hypothetical protein
LRVTVAPSVIRPKAAILHHPHDPRLTGDAKNAGHFRTNQRKDEGSMQPRTHMLYAAALSTGMSFGSAAIAADLPKEGTFSFT